MHWTQCLGPLGFLLLVVSLLVGLVGLALGNMIVCIAFLVMATCAFGMFGLALFLQIA